MTEEELNCYAGDRYRGQSGLRRLALGCPVGDVAQRISACEPLRQAPAG